MSFGASRAIVVALLIATAFPPPRFATLLQASSIDHANPEGKKVHPARGRHRIGSPSRISPTQRMALIAGSTRPRIDRDRRGSRQLEALPRPRILKADLVFPATKAHLRC